jgi:RNA-directed DNA polymerase
MMHDGEKSDTSVVPGKPSNNAAEPAAETVEGREVAKGNSGERNALRTQGRGGALSALDRVRDAARRDRKMRFTALLHHVYDVERLRRAYLGLKREATPGVDGETWEHYGEQLETNLQNLSERLKRGAYRAKPVRRAYIEKADGRQRPLGVPTLEDKVVQRAVVEVLNAIYEQDFLGFSYGFRPKRSPHHALNALTVAIQTRKVNWVLDADIRSFFDRLDQSWLVKLVEHRVADRRVIRLIQKWLSAGVLEEGRRARSEVGTVQGGSVSPLLANIYLHYVFDLWVRQWRRTQARGEVIVVRFADDFVVGFEHHREAEQFLAALTQRLAHFGLELHPDKTRLIEFGRFAVADRQRRGEGKPETFNFLGFTHSCGRTGKGHFVVLRKTMRKRMQAKLQAVKLELQRRRHTTIGEQGKYLGAVMRGHLQYYGVPRNYPALRAFRRAIGRLWRQSLNRRSQRGQVTWERMARILRVSLPQVRICHPYPSLQRTVIT